jgi:hypothetical protein
MPEMASLHTLGIFNLVAQSQGCRMRSGGTDFLIARPCGVTGKNIYRDGQTERQQNAPPELPGCMAR